MYAKKRNLSMYFQKNCAISSVKKGKYRDCEDLSPKCLTED